MFTLDGCELEDELCITKTFPRIPLVAVYAVAARIKLLTVSTGTESIISSFWHYR